MGVLDSILKNASPIGMGIGVLGSIGKMISRGQANRDMKSLISRNPAYQENPLAQQRLSLAQTMLNARMPGSLQAERNIYGSQANQLANVNRNATDASQALAMGAAAQGATNDAFTNLGMQEAGDYQRRYGNLVNAQEGVINEGDKVYQDQVRRYGDETQLRGGIAANRANTWGDVSNLGFGLADFGMAGGFNNYRQPNRNNSNARVSHDMGRNQYNNSANGSTLRDDGMDLSQFNQGFYNWRNRPQ